MERGDQIVEDRFSKIIIKVARKHGDERDLAVVSAMTFEICPCGWIKFDSQAARDLG